MGDLLAVKKPALNAVSPCRLLYGFLEGCLGYGKVGRRDEVSDDDENNTRRLSTRNWRCWRQRWLSTHELIIHHSHAPGRTIPLSTGTDRSRSHNWRT